MSLIDYCRSEKEKKVIAKYIELKVQRATAETTGVPKSTVHDIVRIVKNRASLQGYAPEFDMNKPVPETHVAKGISTNYDADGNVRSQWVKSDLQKEKFLSTVQEIISRQLDSIEPLDIKKETLTPDNDLLNLFVFSDIHLGMYAWHREGGENWDIRKAQEKIQKSVSSLVAKAPEAKIACIALLGDWFHSDGIEPVTPTNRNILDQDTRYAKIIEIGIYLIRYIIETALQEHDKVKIVVAQGNHDQVSALWVQAFLKQLYELKNTVEVLDSPLPFYQLTHGKVALGFTHGNKKKLNELPLYFTQQFRKEWRDCDKIFIHTAHQHRLEEKDISGIMVKQHPTIIPKDSYASHNGYLAERFRSVETYHKDYGRTDISYLTPET